MTIQPIITAALSEQQREEAERIGLPVFVTAFEGWLAASGAFANQDDIDPDVLASAIVAIRARTEAGFDAATYLELHGTRIAGRLPIWEEVLLAALAIRIGLAEDVDPDDLETACRVWL